MAEKGACALPGCTLDFDRILPILQRAVLRGFVSSSHAARTINGLRFGYTGGARRDALERSGIRKFSNYPSSINNRVAVTRAISKRVSAGKTLVLGLWSNSLAASLGKQFTNYFIFPLGGVPKSLEIGVIRPTSDHTRTGLNALSDLTDLRHSLDTYNEIALRLLKGYFMHVSDVADAFPMLPMAPWLWPFYMFKFYLDDSSTHLSLMVQLFADFGGAGWPGEFKIFFADVIVGMARSELVLTLEMPIYVDDMGLIGQFAAAVRIEMRRFQIWAIALGVLFKWLKDRLAARRQLMLGFWWDSIARTRTLEERRFTQYMEMLVEFGSSRSLSLKQRQVVIGRMTRAMMTLPDGAKCLMGEMLRLARGLKLPWQMRRTTRRERLDYKALHSYLEQNMGRGYFSYDQFEWGPETRGDACKGSRSAGGGYASAQLPSKILEPQDRDKLYSY